MLHFLNPPIKYTRLAQAKTVVIPIPWESTTSFGHGTRRAPQAILKGSGQVEFYDPELELEPYLHSIYTAPAPTLYPKSAAKTMQSIRNCVSTYVREGKFVVGLGGEHSLSYGFFLGLLDKYPDLSVLHIDAHCDLRQEYEGSIYSHASVMRRIREHTLKTVSIGIRSLCKEEAELIKQEKINIYFDHQLDHQKLPIEGIIKKLGKNVFITIDVDGFAPAVIPSTGTPEPGGLEWYPTLNLLREVFVKRNVVGADVVELVPDTAGDLSSFTCAKLVYKLIGYRSITG